MSQSVPVYQILSFARHDQDAHFYMTRLEKLVLEFKGIDEPHSHTFYLVMWLRQGSGTHTIDFKTFSIAPNQLYFLTPGQIHSWDLSPDTLGYNLFIEAIFFRGRFGNRLLEYPFFYSHQHQPLLEVTDQQPLFSDLFTIPMRSMNIGGLIVRMYFCRLSISCSKPPTGFIISSGQETICICMTEYESMKI